MLLYSTMVGSHLYGSNHKDSDLDYYYITSTPHVQRLHKKSKVVKHMNGDLDVTCMDLGTFLRHCYDGVPQALEAMFAPKDVVEVDYIAALRRQFYGPIPAMRDRYRRAIRNMSGEDDTPKRKFHALRLAYNFNQAERTGGRFNPRLPQEKIEEFRSLSVADYGEFCSAVEYYADQLF